MNKVSMFAVLAFLPILAIASEVMPPIDNGNGIAVPEPSALSLMLVGVAVIGAIKLRNRFKK